MLNELPLLKFSEKIVEDLRGVLLDRMKNYLTTSPSKFVIKRRYDFIDYLNSSDNKNFKQIFKFSCRNSLGQIEICSISIWKTFKRGKYKYIFISSFEKLGSCSLSDRIISLRYRLEEQLEIFNYLNKTNINNHILKLCSEKIVNIVESNIVNINKNLNLTLDYNSAKNYILNLSENKKIPFPSYKKINKCY